MWTLFREGGFPMYFVLLFGLAGLITAFVFAVRPDKKTEGFIRWITAATIFASIGGTFAALGQVFHYVANHELAGEERALTLCMGFGESMSAGVMGFAFVALIALMAAVGRRRLDARADM